MMEMVIVLVLIVLALVAPFAGADSRRLDCDERAATRDKLWSRGHRRPGSEV